MTRDETTSDSTPAATSTADEPTVRTLLHDESPGRFRRAGTAAPRAGHIPARQLERAREVLRGARRRAGSGSPR